MSPTKDRESFKHQDLTLFLPYLKPFNGSLHSQKKPNFLLSCSWPFKIWTWLPVPSSFSPRRLMQ